MLLKKRISAYLPYMHAYFDFATSPFAGFHDWHKLFSSVLIMCHIWFFRVSFKSIKLSQPPYKHFSQFLEPNTLKHLSSLLLI